ncbi:ABC transporter substrate-binding protein [Tsukamurella tyrosinosolvens]|uniref:ABC transporter substrate-binding protein n=1 Tax=Tsukamurella tyrosinosolvens TaxID=57704 RepID=UPI002DD45157|nr:ABC transporter substrate-binding protein [Tsukamurella tyrosinosolvens]MEC4615535.1 ABC transporter substrate-binding protein [Tsukamurella tyrosinosolvens]
MRTRTFANRTLLTRLSLAATSVVLAASATACGANSPDTMSVMMDVGYLPKHTPFFAAVDHGFFAEEGLDVEVMPGSGSGNTVTAVESGRVDAGWADFAVTVINQGRGAKVKQVNLVQAQSAYAVVSMDGKGISTWDDLVGKTVATEGGGAMTSMWPYALSKLGLDKAAVNVVHAASNAKIPGLLAGQWDANLALSVSDAPAVAGLGRTPVVLRWSDLGINIYGNGIIFSDKEIASNPDRVKRFNRALQRGFLWACANKDSAAQSFHKEIEGYATSTVLTALEEQCSLNWPKDYRDTPYGAMDDAGVQEVLDISRQFLGLKNRDLMPNQVYDNSFLSSITRDEQIVAPKA